MSVSVTLDYGSKNAFLLVRVCRNKVKNNMQRHVINHKVLHKCCFHCRSNCVVILKSLPGNFAGKKNVLWSSFIFSWEHPEKRWVIERTGVLMIIFKIEIILPSKIHIQGMHNQGKGIWTHHGSHWVSCSQCSRPVSIFLSYYPPLKISQYL